MDRGQIALKLFLDELGIDFDIKTIDDRKRVQKAVYLGQLSGVDLGYRFGWYIRGPYSTSLTNDYFPLAESLASEDNGWEGKTLKKSVKEKLARIKPLMEPPHGVSLRQEDWLELVASLDYLRRVSRLDDEEARKILKKEKSHVFEYVEEAKQALIEADLFLVN
ncbi:hypothetical protein GF413_00420 [Candidatus Micrarchaeota archaeon]|nr:hypothetical protein [Candidatus Micrarchaeota archaeon]